MSEDERPIVGTADIIRITDELCARFDDDDEENAEKWTSSAGVDLEAVQGFIFAAVKSIQEDAQQKAGEIISELDPEDFREVEIAPGLFVRTAQSQMDIGELIASAMFHCFTVGWECGREYGRR